MNKATLKIGIILFVVLMVFTNNSITFATQELTSKQYLISERYSYIGRILPRTTIEQFKRNFNTESSNIKVYKDSNLTKEATSGYITSGMKAKFSGIDKTYDINVVGDIDNDGLSNQIEIQYMIKYILGMQKDKLGKQEFWSEDINNDGEINQIDLRQLINYSVFGRLSLNKWTMPKKPEIEVISGEKDENNTYTTDVKVKITQIETVNVEETTYSITGAEEVEETNIPEDGKIIISENGTYEIKANTYLKNGLQSEEAKLIINKRGPEGPQTQDVPELVEGEDIIFTAIPTYWTNGEVAVTITQIKEHEGYTLQYAQKNIGEEPEENDWEDYKEENVIELTQNGIVYARLRNSAGQGGKTVARKEISNIDKLAPTEFTVNLEEVVGNASNSIIVKGHTSDQEENNMYGNSRIKAYYFKAVEASDDEEIIKQETGWIGPVEANEENDVSYTFENLKQGTMYAFAMKAVDNAGNETISESVTANMDEVPGLTEDTDVIFTASPTYWTNGEVAVTITQIKTYEGYTLQYAQKNVGEEPEENDWKDYKEGETAIKLTQNGTVYARLRDGINQGGKVIAKKEINNIDKLKPTEFTISLEEVVGNASNSITVKGHTSDQEENNMYGSSKIKEYYFKEVEENDSDEKIAENTGWTGPVETNEESDVSYTFENLVQGTTHYFVIKAVDNAGNETISEKVTAKTQEVPGLTEDVDVTLTASPIHWTNGNVIVTITQIKPHEGYTLQYAQKNIGEVLGENDWKDYEAGKMIKLTQNGIVYARLRDSINQGGKVIVKKEISNIDKLEPTAFTAKVEETTTNALNSITSKGHTKRNSIY